MSLATVTTTSVVVSVSACTFIAVFRQPRIKAFTEASSVVLEVLILFRCQRVSTCRTELSSLRNYSYRPDFFTNPLPHFFSATLRDTARRRVVLFETQADVGCGIAQMKQNAMGF
jgi:hypothetical protein